MFLLQIFWATCVHTRRHTPGRLCSIAAQQSYFRCFRVLSPNILLMKRLLTFKHTNTLLVHSRTHKHNFSILHSFGLFLSEHSTNNFFLSPTFQPLGHHSSYYFCKYNSFSIQSHLRLSVKLSVKTFCTINLMMK